jgi:hypothetical protein
MSGETSGPESSDMLTTDPRTPPQTRRATLHDRIEHDRAEKERAGQPTHSQGAGTTRIAALIAAARARDDKSS